MVCSVARCNRPLLAKGLCNTHYIRKRLGRCMDVPITKRSGPCRVCGKPNYGLQACEEHYKQVRTWLRKCGLIKISGGKCLDCNRVFPSAVFDFHHRDPQEKSFTIGQKLNDVSWQALVDEVKKCDLLCANCHRLRHNKEEEWQSLKMQLDSYFVTKAVT